MTFAQEIEHLVGDEEIEAVVVGEFGWDGYKSAFKEGEAPKTKLKMGKVATWEQVKPSLDYNVDHGFGAPDCHAIYVWTKTRIIFVSTYDGSTDLDSIPRNPTDVKPEMFGGG